MLIQLYRMSISAAHQGLVQRRQGGEPGPPRGASPPARWKPGLINAPPPKNNPSSQNLQVAATVTVVYSVSEKKRICFEIICQICLKQAITI